ncbi:glycosyltransferase family 4 protein [Pleurocapsales cyanobacterium LEGE 10410]|nr:glycosyltransferase family 4 protein [Pleurocapsales cyanobacterium LEGE 10410]
MTKEKKTNKTYRIACHGVTRENSGSGVGASYLILEELLKRGHQIDFFNHKGSVYPKNLLNYKNFNFFNTKRYPSSSFSKKLPPTLQKTTPIIDAILNPLTAWSIYQEVLAKHKQKSYELLFFSERYPLFNLEKVPTVAWCPSPPQTERYYNLQKLRKEIISINGILLYIKLLVLYGFKAIFVMPRIKENYQHTLICGSKWSKEKMVSYGFKPENIKALPYPVDTEIFNLDLPLINRKKDEIVLLWLGRSDPRKRLDLLLAAYELVLQERKDIKLKIFAQFRYAPKYKKLINHFPFPDRIEYQPYIERTQVPNLMAQCDALIQPSEGENFGSSVAEALCCGLPVIVGPTNGTKDYISASSFVFSEYTPKSLKETMLKAIEAIERDRQGLAMDARKTAEINFDVSRVVDRLEDIFDEATTSRKTDS